MHKKVIYLVFSSLLATLPQAATAQDQKPEAPYNAQLVVRQPEAGAGAPAFVPSAQVRGMKALADGKVYWVSADNRQLLAYQGNRLAWRADVVGACPQIIGPRKISKVTLSSNTILVRVGERTFAEVDADTGKTRVAAVQKN